MVRTAVLGMGQMGRALAGRLLATGHEVTVWNRTPGRVEALRARGAGEAADPGAAATGADVTILVLADDEAVRDVAARLNPDGLPGVVVNCSTVAPQTTAWLDARFANLIAAPILGAPAAVESGQAVYLLAGRPAVVDGFAGWWEGIGALRRVGNEPALASAAKLMANYLLLTGLAALGEAIAIGRAGGLDDGYLRSFLTEVPLVAPALRNRLDNAMGDDHAGWFTTLLGAKDVRLAAELGEAAGAELPLARLVEGRYREAAERGWAADDIAAVAELARPGRRPPG